MMKYWMLVLFPLTAWSIDLPVQRTLGDVHVAMVKSENFNTPKSENVIETGGEIRLYFWRDADAKTQKLEPEFEIEFRVSMEKMKEICGTNDFYEKSWKVDGKGFYLVGESFVMPGEYQVVLVLKKDGTSFSTQWIFSVDTAR